jgi:hypothetical protein
MARASTMLILGLCGLALLGCKENGEPSTEPLELIPAELHGVYGRTPQDTPGLTVNATGIEFGDLKFTIHEGKLEGDTVRIERATLQWQKLEPKTCSGTVSRQGDQLLFTLYEVGGGQKNCDSLLEAAWFAWEPLTELPAALQGRYNVLTIAANQLKVELGWFEATMRTDKIYRLHGSNDVRVELLVDDGKILAVQEDGTSVETTCTGTIKLDEGWLSTEFWVPKQFQPKPDEADQAVLDKFAAHERTCTDWEGRAQKFVVDLARLPKAPISKDQTSLTIAKDKVVLASPDMRCEQELWQTESVSASYGILGGERMTLGNAEPTAVSKDCAIKQRIWCERDVGNETVGLDTASEPADNVQFCLDELERLMCPDTILVQPVSDIRSKLAIEPALIYEVGCLDLTGDFSLSK